MWKLDSVLVDVETAFLMGDLEEEIYMEYPEGMDAEDDEVLLLLQAIYGLVQASRQYWKKYVAAMKKLGFRISESMLNV